jgi:hypothetical protein
LLGSIFQVGGDSVKTPYETEYPQNPTSPIITVTAAGQLTSKKIYFLPWEPNKDATLLIESIKTFVSNALKKHELKTIKVLHFQLSVVVNMDVQLVLLLKQLSTRYGIN